MEDYEGKQSRFPGPEAGRKMQRGYGCRFLEIRAEGWGTFGFQGRRIEIFLPKEKNIHNMWGFRRKLKIMSKKTSDFL